MAKDIFTPEDYLEIEEESRDELALSPWELLASEETREREYILKPIIFKGSRTLIYAASGIGKTYFGLGLTASISSSYMFNKKWTKDKPYRVLYIDGEMGFEAIKKRFSLFARSSLSGVTFLCFDKCKNNLPPNIADPKVQRRLLEIASDYDAVIFDNWCSLRRPFEKRQDDTDLWRSFHVFNITLSARGKATVMIHHAGKSGSYLGTSEMTQAMDIVLRLQRPSDYQESQGATFEMVYEKARDLKGEDTESQLVVFKSDLLGTSFSFTPISETLPTKIMKLKNLNMSDRQIAAELNLPYSKVLSILADSNCDDGCIRFESGDDILF